MTTEATNVQGAALNLERYAVPAGVRVVVQPGVAMRVPEGFRVDGELILYGQLKVGEA